MTHIFKGDFSKLENAERKKKMPASAILSKIGIKSGDTVIDFGCGIGYFSIPALDLVGKDGQVIALDISNVMIDELSRRTKDRDNIFVIQSDKVNFSGDIILAVNVLHEVPDAKSFISSCMSKLNNDGKLVIIDWQKKDMKNGPPLDHRISKEDVIEMMGSGVVEKAIHEDFYFLVKGK